MEAVRAFVLCMMNKLTINRILEIRASENMASRTVMRRCDFVKEYGGMGMYQGKQQLICRFIYTVQRSVSL